MSLIEFRCFQITSVINMALDAYFPDDEGIEIIAEPGRYMVASAFTLVVNVIAKRVVARDEHGESKSLYTAQGCWILPSGQ